MTDECLSLGAYPLVDRYFGDFLRKLAAIRQSNPDYEGHFVHHAFYSEALERRLWKVEELRLTQSIVDEVGDTDDAHELDKRLMDAWAEIRTLDQLQREGFSRIGKVGQTADFTADCDGLQYAFQVTHINRRLPSQIARRNPPEQRNSSPYGSIPEVRDRLAEPISYLFWDSLIGKNSRFRAWPAEGWRRCVVLVTNEEALQDRLVRHIACQQLRDCIHYLQKRHFEELFLLLDNGNGARFLVGDSPGQTRCLADWKDEFPGPETNFRPADVSIVSRREVDLDTWYPAWREDCG